VYGVSLIFWIAETNCFNCFAEDVDMQKNELDNRSCHSDEENMKHPLERASYNLVAPGSDDMGHTDIMNSDDFCAPVSIGQVSEKGRKHQNEDSLGFYIPDDSGCIHKGIVAVIADGVSTAEAGKEASETCVKNFLSDYFSTPDSWTVKASVQRILTALNRWLYSQSVGKYAANRGYISTLSAIVMQGDLVHIFHIGDSRVYRLRDGHFEQLTRDHSRRVNEETCYLTRAMGMDINLEVDYFCTSLESGDVFFLSTDGVHDFVTDSDIRQQIMTALASDKKNLEDCCEQLIKQALANGSDDNLSCQLVLFNQMPYLLNTTLTQRANSTNLHMNFLNLPFLDRLEPGQTVDGLWVMAVISRQAMYSEYHVKDVVTGKQYVMRAPVKSLENDLTFKSHFVLEPWAANMMKHPQILAYPTDNKFKHHFYYLHEYDTSMTLKTWMSTRDKLYLETCLDIIHQLLSLVRLLHQKDIVLLNISAENILIDAKGRIKLTDFSACYVQGMPETRISAYRNKLTSMYAAPEFLLEDKPHFSADVFSISVLAYKLMTDVFPYGADYLKCASLNDYFRLKMHPACHMNPMIPAWLEANLMKGLSIIPRQRYSQADDMVQALSPQVDAAIENFVEDQAHQSAWKALSGMLLLTQIATLIWFLL
jgi:serine/threonine protein phosphatase PrpC